MPTSRTTRSTWTAAVELSRPGSLIVGDNVVRDGAVADAQSTDPNVIAVRRFLEAIGATPSPHRDGDPDALLRRCTKAYGPASRRSPARPADP